MSSSNGGGDFSFFSAPLDPQEKGRGFKLREFYLQLVTKFTPKQQKCRPVVPLKQSPLGGRVDLRPLPSCHASCAWGTLDPIGGNMITARVGTCSRTASAVGPWRQDNCVPVTGYFQWRETNLWGRGGGGRGGRVASQMPQFQIGEDDSNFGAPRHRHRAGTAD